MKKTCSCFSFFQNATFQHIWPWLAALFSGIFLGIAFPPYSADWIIWIALTPLISSVWFASSWKRYNGLHLFLLGWLAGATGFCISFWWITEVTHFGWFALSVYCGLFPGVFCLFLGTVGLPRERKHAIRSVWLSSRATLAYSLLGGMAWAGLEWGRTTLFSGFGWNGLGVALWQNVPMLQISDLTGVYGLSFLICWVNIMLVLTVKRLTLEIGTGTMRPHYDFALTLAAVALTFTYGIRQILAPLPSSFPLRIASVQANIPQDQKWDPDYVRRIMERYRTQSETAIAMDPDLLIWPEAATPRAVFSDQAVWAIVQGLAARWNGDFLLGSVNFSPKGDFNSAILLTDHGKTVSLYNKIHLVPFGEFIPFRNSFPLFSWIIGDLVPSDFDAGEAFTVLKTRRQPVQIGALICFEDTLGDLARQFVLNGAQLFVTVTNDGWFRESAGSRQHLAQAVFRCAENKIPMVRSANTGVTCWIDTHGRVAETLANEAGSTFIEGVLFGEFKVPIEIKPTFYARNGDVFAIGCLIIATLFSGMFYFRQRCLN